MHQNTTKKQAEYAGLLKKILKAIDESLQRLADFIHERRILRERRALLCAKTLEGQATHAARMRFLIKRRSKGQVARMEREKGLM